MPTLNEFNLGSKGTLQMISRTSARWVDAIAATASGTSSTGNEDESSVTAIARVKLCSDIVGDAMAWYCLEVESSCLLRLLVGVLLDMPRGDRQFKPIIAGSYDIRYLDVRKCTRTWFASFLSSNNVHHIHINTNLNF